MTEFREQREPLENHEATNHPHDTTQPFGGFVGDTTISVSGASAVDAPTSPFTAEGSRAAIGGGRPEQPADEPEGSAAGAWSDTAGEPGSEAPRSGDRGGFPPIPPIEGGRTGSGESDDGSEAARTSDALFDVLAGERITAVHQARGVAYTQSRGAAWLGDGSTPPQLEAGYNIIPNPPDNRAVTPVIAGELAVHQLHRFSASYRETAEGAAASHDLVDFVSQDAFTGIIDRTTAELPAGSPQAYRAGQYSIDVTPDGITQLTDHGLFVPDDTPQLLRYDTPDGESRLIRPDSQERFIITNQDGATRIDRETLRTLEADTTHYFHDLGRQLSQHQRLLAHVALEVGVDIEEYTDPKTGQLDANNPKLAAIDARVAEAEPRLNSAIRFMVSLSAGTVYHMVRERSITDSRTGITKKHGLRAAKQNVTSYYDALLRGPAA